MNYINPFCVFLKLNKQIKTATGEKLIEHSIPWTEHPWLPHPDPAMQGCNLELQWHASRHMETCGIGRFGLANGPVCPSLQGAKHSTRGCMPKFQISLTRTLCLALWTYLPTNSKKNKQHQLSACRQIKRRIMYPFRVPKLARTYKGINDRLPRHLQSFACTIQIATLFVGSVVAFHGLSSALFGPGF